MKTLIVYTVTDLDAMLAKGNVWYMRHYEAWYDKVYVLYVLGNRRTPITNGRTTLITLGRRYRKLDLLLAPYRLYRFAKQHGPADYLTADPLFFWFISALIRILLKAKIYLMPVCIPEQIYKTSKKSLSGLPICLEKFLIKLSFMSADRVITGKNISIYIDWLSSISYVKPKLHIVDTIVDELPTLDFFEALEVPVNRSPDREKIVLYVGRLHGQKLLEDVIWMFALLKQQITNVRLWIVGDGSQRKMLEKLAVTLGVRDVIDFWGAKPNGELVNYYKKADVFVSPLTGTSLREAALCRLPVVAYNIDWVSGFLVNEKNALLVKKGNIAGLTNQVMRLLDDRQFAERLAGALHEYAVNAWNKQGVARALQQTFA